MLAAQLEGVSGELAGAGVEQSTAARRMIGRQQQPANKKLLLPQEQEECV